MNEPWLSGKKWQAKAQNAPFALAVAQRYGLPEILGELMAQRGVPLESVEDYLVPSIRNLLPDPSHLQDMDKAAARLAQAVQSGEIIGIFGDYDVDGATSSAILLRYLRECGARAVVHIPDRQKEGYGPNLYGFGRLREQGASLIVTVDTGALAHQVLGEAAAQGYEVIVFDHHQGEEELPSAVAIVNPNRYDETTEYRYLAAVGVTFLALVALHKTLREAGYFAQRKEPDLLALLDIVALGTVCDVVPLKGLNRAFVVQGLKILAQKHNAGLAALLAVGGVEDAPTPYHLGFVLGPRINAGGRVGQADLGVQLLTCDNFEQAHSLAEQLDLHNRERKAIESQVQEAAMQQAEAQIAGGEKTMLFAVGQHWHEGVIGIVAGRLKEKFGLPVAVIALNEQGQGKASARSVSGVDMGQMVIAARQSGLLEAGGGHAMAAGFTVTAEKRDAFIAFARERLAQAVVDYDAHYVHEYAATLPISAATPELAAKLEQVGPFGAGNAAPRFRVDGVRVVQAEVIGKTGEHLRLIVAEPQENIGRSTGSVKVMSFGTVNEPFGQQLLAAKGREVSLIVRLQREEWRGRVSVSLMLEDALIA